MVYLAWTREYWKSILIKSDAYIGKFQLILVQSHYGLVWRVVYESSWWLPSWAQIWILQHINCVFLMKNRIHIQNLRRNHLLSLFLQFGTLSVKWISHIHLMDLSYSCVLFLHYSNLQLCQVDLKWSCTWKCTLLGSQSYKSQRKEDSAKRFFSKLGEESSFWMKSSYV